MTVETDPVATRVDRADRRIVAPPEGVFARWTDPATPARGLPPPGLRGRVDALDARPGGDLRLVVTHDDPAIGGKSGAGDDVVEGRSLALDPPRRLAFVVRFRSDDPVMRGRMRMDWRLDPETGGTRGRVAARDVPPDIKPADHAAGMAASLAQLAALAERLQGPDR